MSALKKMQGWNLYVYLNFISSLPCLHTFWHTIPTSSYIFLEVAATTFPCSQANYTQILCHKHEEKFEKDLGTRQATTIYQLG